MPDRAVPVGFRKGARLTIGRDQLLYVIELLLEPLTLVLSLWAVGFWIEGRIGRPIDVTSIDMPAQWNTVDMIVAYVEREKHS